jgi:cytochrome c peroxidase
VFAQPRAAVYRATTRSLLVASEGRDALVELDALSIAPAAHELERYELTNCGAPTGIAVSADEVTAYVFCRSTATLATVTLEESPGGHSDRYSDEIPIPRVATLSLADDPLAEEAALGRRLFYNATDNVMSFSFGCAGCHPDGRDDGHVWHEIGDMLYRAFPERQPFSDIPIRGEPRQTPMLAGRVADEGPYGWRGKDTTLEHRLIHGFALHHWYARWGEVDGGQLRRARALARFLREGLVPPPVTRDAGEAVRRGEALFHDATTGCAGCHTPEREYSDRQRSRLDLRAANASFVSKEQPVYRTPSLRFVGGTPPYLHDGGAATLEALLDANHDRMGMTSQLAADERAALLAFLRTL